MLFAAIIFISVSQIPSTLMTNLINKVIVIFLLFLSISCTDQTKGVLPKPLVNFTYKYDERIKVAEANKPVDFVNETTHAVEYEWNFGDGNFSTEKNPTHTYDKAGEYSVSLLGKNAQGLIEEKIAKVTVVERTIFSINIRKMSTTKPDGTQWDVGEDPDALLYFGEVNNPERRYAFKIKNDYDIFSFPIFHFFGFNPEVFLTDKDWYWILVEDDVPMNTVGENDEHMYSTVFNPVNPQHGEEYIEEHRGGKIDFINGKNVFGNSASDSNYEISIEWRYELP